MRKSTTSTLAVAAALLLVVGAAAPATAHRDGHPPAPPTPQPVAEHLAGPLSFDLGPHRSIVVAQSFAGLLTKIRPGRAPVDLVTAPGIDVGAVSIKDGATTWAETTLGPDGFPVGAVVKRMSRHGTVTELADVRAYEDAHNPDADETYGFIDLTPECAATLPPDLLARPGITDSHPYGSVTVRRTTYIADAGANAIFAIDKRGNLSTLAVLPGVPVQVPAEAAEALGLDPCVAGHTFVLEPVPTDVEVGKHGDLYVTTLPGGPEDGSLGANGQVYKIDRRTGHAKLIASGLAGATNLAIGRGTIYVTELFGGRVSTIGRGGSVTPFAELSQPAAIEYAHGKVYVAIDVFGDASIVSLRAKR